MRHRLQAAAHQQQDRDAAHALHSTAAMNPALLIAVGFLDASGTHLLVESGTGLTRAVCSDQVVTVRHVKTQPRGPKDTGRRTARNFDQAPGELYAIDGKLPSSN